MAHYQKPIQRSLLTGSVLFVLCLCLLSSALSFRLFSTALYTRYNERLTGILTFVESSIDAEDMAACINSGKRSEKYIRLQEMLNRMVDDFSLYYLYIIIPLDDSAGTMINVISATSEAERAAGETDLPLLMVSNAYPKEEVDRFRAVWEGGELRFFEESSDYGDAYTACKPLKKADGQVIALMCADLPIESLHRTVHSYVILNSILTILIGILFGAMLLFWLQRNVTGPVEALERSTRSFAEKSHESKDPDALLYEPPQIHTLNEVESLADAITAMSEDIKAYIEEILTTEGRLKTAEMEVEGMTKIAYQDALTRLKNKAACNGKMAELAVDIAGGKARFAILMADLNRLKYVNDTYGHEKGDQYIIGASRIISNVFKHSPVYRVGGDEFVVIMQGGDYDSREELYRDMREQFRQASEDSSRQPWERYSAASGLAEYVSAADETVEQVLKRADRSMYRNKEEMKAGRT